MPALIANTVTLEEVLEVRGGPLIEEELWSLLAQSCQALYDIFVSGKARKRHFGTYTITPATILLCHTGNVKFSLDADRPNDRSFTAPETYNRKAFPSEATLEKICVYSLGMSLYHAAEFEVAIGKPISLHESLENILLTMCEDSAQARSSLTDVLQECRSRYRRRNYRDVVASLVESVLGDEIPDIDLEDAGFDNEAFQNDNIVDYNSYNEKVYTSCISPVLASPRHLPTPPPPQISTRGQPTSAELVGSNHRRALTPPLRQKSTSPGLNNSRNLPPSLEKYKTYLEESRSKRPMGTSLNGLDQLDSKPPAKHQRMADAGHSPRHKEFIEEHERKSQAKTKLPADLEPRLKVNGTRNELGNGLRRYSSVNSVTSNSSSIASGPRSSMFSDGRSSSAISLTQGSYALESYITDGYESEFYLNSMGSSVSRNRFRNERQKPTLRDQQYVSVSDLSGRPPPAPSKSLPTAKQFKSLPDISKEWQTPREKNVSPDKTFFGPEFVMITEDPEKSIVNITPNLYLKKDAQKKGGSQNRRMVTVVALNGQKLQLMAEVSMTTKELYEHVIKFLGITEKSFFGLAKLEDEEVIFLELDVKLSKYAPPKWKEPKGEIVEFILYFRVKFYVEHTALLSHLSSRHQFYLQLRKDLLEGRLYCHEEAAFVLAGLALQAETGDYDESLDQEYFLIEHYLHPRIINKVSAEYALHQLPEFHQNFAGLSEEQAELDFVEEAQKLPEYGIHFYKVQVNKKSDSDKLYLGICVRGITVYESTGHIKSPIHKHSWPLTKKISFKKKKFFIEPRANPDGAKLTFYTNHYKKAKYLLSMCTAFHRFQMKMRTRLASIEHEVGLDFAAEKQQKHCIDGPWMSTYERTRLPPLYKQNLLDTPRGSIVRSVSQEYNPEDPREDSYKEMSVDVNHNIGSHGNSKTVNCMLSTTSVHDETIDKHDERPYVIDSTLNELRKQEPNQEDDVKERLLPLQELDVSKSKDVLASPEREIRVIKLKKEPYKGLGITVLGGENSKRLDLGIYVKSITDGGSAAKDGRLKTGDRILAVNGNSLEHVTHEKAVSLLKTTSSTVELVVSQSPHNISALDLSNIPNATLTNEEPQTLEVKPLITPPQYGKRHHVESQWSSDTQSPTESPPSTFNFISEDEPVTMISKSISSLASNPPSNQVNEAREDDLTKAEESIPEPATVATVQSFNSVPNEITSATKATPPLAETRLSSLDSHQSEMSSESYTAGSERSAELEISDKSFVVELEKVSGSLGLSVTGGINTTVKHGAIYIKSLILNGPADRNGRVRIGDRILEVNGVSLKSVTHKQAVEIIKRAPQHCKILIDRSIHVNVPTSIKKTSRNQTPDQPFIVELRKGIGGLGLSLVGGRDADPQHGGLLRIKKMFPGQPAALSNQLLVGDIVLEVNGNSLENASHQDAINLIRHEPSIVRLLVKRCPSSIPEVLLSRASSDASDIDPAQLLNDIQSKLRTDAVKSPPQPLIMRESQPNLDAANQKKISEELSNQNSSPDRTDIWVKQESPRIRPHGFEIERSLTHQISDPVVKSTRKMEHEPVTSSNSLPGKFSLKSHYFDKVSEENIVKKKSSVSSTTSGVDKRDSVNIQSDSNLPLLFKNIKSQDSLHRTMSPRAPLAEYEESDIDEGIMISVDDGSVLNIRNNSHMEDMDRTLSYDNQEISNDKEDSRHDKDSDLNSSDDQSHFNRTDEETEELLLETKADHYDTKYDKYGDQNHNTLEHFPPPPVNMTDDNYSSFSDNTNSDEDIDSVLELLDAVHKDAQVEKTKTIEKQGDKIVLDLHEPQQPKLSSPDIIEKSDTFSTEISPELEANQMAISETNEDPSDKSHELVNGELAGSNEENFEQNSNIDGNSNVTAEEDNGDSSLTPKEELLVVELEKGDSGGLGFTLAGGADTMGGCFVRDIIGDPAKSDGRLQKGDQILQVDDIDIREMKHMTAVNILRATKKNVKLIVLRRPTLIVNDGSSLETVNLTRTSRGRIGLLLTEVEDGIILVDDVVPGEPAAAEGNLKHGDRIVEIGGRKVDGVGFLTARQYLDASRPVVQLLVERRNQAAFSKYSMGGASLDQSLSLSEDLTRSIDQWSDEGASEQESDIEKQTDVVINVELEKGPRGFGFSLAPPSSELYTQGIFIKTISPGSVAEKDGRLEVGDELLTVNGEDVRNLSHARVIGMLRKVTTTVTLEIRRPGHGARPVKEASITTASKEAGGSPSSNSIDLDITLEDKKVQNLTESISSKGKDEDKIVDLLSSVTSGTSKATPTSGRPTKPKLNKRDTDSVLSSLLSSIGSPTVPSNANDLNGSDVNESDSDLGYPSFDRDSPSVDSDSPLDTGSSLPILDDGAGEDIEGISANTLKSPSSTSLEDSSADQIKSNSEESIDSDYDDVDVFDMLRDNSENIKREDTANSCLIDLLPPMPTTPIPSDDEDVPPPLPRKRSLNKSSDDGWSSESDLTFQPKVNGFLSLHSSGSEEELNDATSGPLVDVISNGRYTGHKLKMLIGALQAKLNSNAPSDEFRALREIKPADNCDAAKHPDNKDKNRYRNVLPYNSTRVRLSGKDNEDYINASHIRVPVGQDTHHYIATQGPLPNTIEDFWQMVWEQGVEVIAMVTLEKEGGKVKCTKYWPNEPNTPLKLTKFEVSLLEENVSQSFTERTISLKHRQTGVGIEVTHLNFTTWPDHGVPKCSVEMVQFVTYLRSLTSSEAPILVHCSAGIGRTGALLTVDVSLGLIKRDQIFDVDRIIRILREQRQGMIQTKEQYIFCYTACLDVLRSLKN